MSTKMAPDVSTPSSISNAMASAADEKLVRQYSHVQLTLHNILYEKERLENTLSRQDGLSEENELSLRNLGCDLIVAAGILLKLPQVAAASAQVIYQRYYYAASFVRRDYEHIAMASVNLAAKIEEAPRRMRDVINVFHHVKQVRNGRRIQPLILDQNYVNLKQEVIKAERRLLKELGFCAHVKQPHKIIFMYLQVLEKEKHVPLVQKAWNYMNDSFRIDAFMRYDPEIIACACIYLAARALQVPLPESPPWWEVFRVTSVQIMDIANAILHLYKAPKPSQANLDAELARLKERIAESKRIARTKRVGELSGAKDANSSPVGGNCSGSPSGGVGGSPTVRPLLSQSELRKIKSEADMTHSNRHHQSSRNHDRHDGGKRRDARPSDSSASSRPQPNSHDRRRSDRAGGGHDRAFSRDDRDRHRGGDRKPHRRGASTSSPDDEDGPPRRSSSPPPAHHRRGGSRKGAPLRDQTRRSRSPKGRARSRSPVGGKRSSPPLDAFAEAARRLKRAKLNETKLETAPRSRSGSPGDISPIRVKKHKIRKPVDGDLSPQPIEIIKLKERKHKNREKLREK